MAQAEAHVIMPRRGFLTRAFGLTAAGVTLALPIITAADARTQAELHLKELHKALSDLYPLAKFRVAHRFPEGEQADPRVLDDMPLVAIVANNANLRGDKWVLGHAD